MRSALGVASVLFAVIAWPARAQAQARAEVPVFGTGTDVVAVPVFVTDKSGKAVAGLTADAFQIEDHGKPVPIIAFEAVDAGAPKTLPGRGNLERAAARRQFVILIDMSFSTVAGVRRAQDGARDFVATGLSPTDLVSVATFGSAGLKVLVGFTSDRAQVAEAIGGLANQDRPRVSDPLSLAYSFGPEPSADTSSIKEQAQSEADEHIRGQAVLLERTEQRYYRTRVESFVSGLEGLGKLLDSVQGRKQVILLSGGFDQKVLGGAEGEQRIESTTAVAEGRTQDVDPDEHFGSTGASQVLQQLFRGLAASDTVLHTVDVTGLAAAGDLSESGRSSSGAGRTSLALLAANSGGRFIRSTNNMGMALREISDASRHYYVVAFESREPAGKKAQVRRLKVKVRGDGLRVSHRSAYTLGRAAEAVAGSRAQLQAAEVIAKGLSGGDIGLRAVAMPYRNAQGRLSLPVVLQIDGNSLLVPDVKSVSLQVFGYAFDAAGRIADFVVLTPTLDVAKVEARLRERGFQMLTAFQVKPGSHEVRFLVREMASGRSGALRQSVEVPEFAKDTLALSPPLFMDDPSTRMVVPAPSRGNPQLEIPFRVADTPFTVEAMPFLKNGAATEVCVMSWKGPSYATTSPLEVSADLLGTAGQVVPLPMAAPRIVADADGFQRFVLSLRLAGVPPGQYTLRVGFREPERVGVATSEQPVRVE